MYVLPPGSGGRKIANSGPNKTRKICLKERRSRRLKSGVNINQQGYVVGVVGGWGQGGGARRRAGHW